MTSRAGQYCHDLQQLRREVAAARNEAERAKRELQAARVEIEKRKHRERVSREARK